MSPSRTGVDESKLADGLGPVRRWLMQWFGRRVQNPADVEDMVQDVFARVVARTGAEPIDHLGGYLLKTASSVLADRARRGATHAIGRHIEFDSEIHGEAEDVDPERVLDGREELHAVVAALLCLPERTRTVFVLRRLEGHRFADIARQLDISISAVEKHMVRAIQHLSIELEKRRGS